MPSLSTSPSSNRNGSHIALIKKAIWSIQDNSETWFWLKAASMWGWPWGFRMLQINSSTLSTAATTDNKSNKNNNHQFIINHHQSSSTVIVFLFISDLILSRLGPKRNHTFAIQQRLHEVQIHQPGPQGMEIMVKRPAGAKNLGNE